jgi:hypothetical protein
MASEQQLPKDDASRSAINFRRNAPVLARYIRITCLQPVDLYASILIDRLLPALSDDEISKEADRIETETFERLGTKVAPEDYDPATTLKTHGTRRLNIFLT